MADLAYRREVRPNMVTDWGAIWAGIFAYYGIFIVFGVLAIACFSSAGYAGVWGYGVWAIVLNAIAFYVAGHMTGSNASVATPSQGMRHGLYMFGIATVGEILLAGIIYAFSAVVVAGRQQIQSGWNYAGWSWPVWIALFFGFVAAMVGARLGVASSKRELGRTEETEPVSIRPAA